MKWFTAFLLTLLLCFIVISYSSATIIDPIDSDYKWHQSDDHVSDVTGWWHGWDENRWDWNWWDETWWDELDGECADDDNVSHTPIPPAVWLLSSGLVGIIAIRRKFKN